MDTYALNLLVITSLSLLLYGVTKAIYAVWYKPKRLEKMLKQPGINGTAYKPLVGDGKEFMRLIIEAWSKPLGLSHAIAERVDPFTLSSVRKHGNLSVCWFGTTPRMIINDPEMIKEVMTNKLHHFGKPPLTPLILFLTKAGLTVLDGPDWARHRRIINPAFHYGMLKGMVSAFTTSCDKMIQELKKRVSPQGSYEVDMWIELQKLTADVISRAAFGSSYEEGNKIFELQKELIQLTLEAMQSAYIPGFRFVPTKKNRRRKKLDKQITSMLRVIIETRLRAMGTGQSNDDDLLGIMLQALDKNDLPESTNINKSDKLSLEEVIEECKQFYLAGQETSSSWLTWTMVVLAMHPEWQEKARQEVLGICGKKEPTFEDIRHLKIVSMILNEVLRLYPPVIALYQHAYKDTKIGDITIPAGVDLNLPILLVHHDPELWGDDVEEFKPDRFSDGVSKACKEQLAFLPFGFGPRTCIGQGFATVESKFALAMILQNFSFELSPSYAHAPYTVMTLQPQFGAQITLHQL